MNLRKFDVPRREGKSWLEDFEHALLAKTLSTSQDGSGIVFFDEEPKVVDLKILSDEREKE